RRLERADARGFRRGGGRLLAFEPRRELVACAIRVRQAFLHRGVLRGETLLGRLLLLTLLPQRRLIRLELFAQRVHLVDDAVVLLVRLLEESLATRGFHRGLRRQQRGVVGITVDVRGDRPIAHDDLERADALARVLDLRLELLDPGLGVFGRGPRGGGCPPPARSRRPALRRLAVAPRRAPTRCRRAPAPSERTVRTRRRLRPRPKPLGVAACGRADSPTGSFGGSRDASRWDRAPEEGRARPSLAG